MDMVLKLNQKLMLITDMVAMEVTVDMDTAASADLLLLRHLQLLTMAMEDTEDMVAMDMVANADLLKLHQLHIMDMADTEDTVDMDMVVNDDLLSLIMDMEVTEDMDTDMDVELIPLNSEEKNSTPYPKSYQMKKIPVHPMILSSQNKKQKKEIFDLTTKKIKKTKFEDLR